MAAACSPMPMVPVAPSAATHTHTRPKSKMYRKYGNYFLTIKFGKVNGIPTGRVAIQHAIKRWDPEGRIYFDPGLLIKNIDIQLDPKNRELRMFPILRFAGKNDEIVCYQYGKTANTRGKFHKAGTTRKLIKMAAAFLNDKHACPSCGDGSIFFKRNGSYPGTRGEYVGTYNRLVRLPGKAVCDKCERFLHPTKAVFNPVPELDDDGMPYDNIFSDCVTELAWPSREALLDDPEYMAALDKQATNEFLGSGTDDATNWDFMNLRRLSTFEEMAPYLESG